jgi:hypothetical protein
LGERGSQRTDHEPGSPRRRSTAGGIGRHGGWLRSRIARSPRTRSRQIRDR